ncbi:hypothetical protein FQA39_LY17322 [Lamprigera yunnana]|nr:hypothetical protein FQA39_LY17322 [Lamprigera yunnana]
MKSLFVFTLLTLSLSNFHCWKIFHRGRVLGGNLGEPIGRETLYAGEEISDQWFDQKLDHFNPTDQRTWKQRYFVNDQFYNNSVENPVFLMIGGEGIASPKWMTQGSWIDYAKRFNALCFQLEHRYYGKSHPTENLNTENLVYLSSQQALADLANFVVVTNKRYNLSSKVKWIVFGGSYPGSLAAWMRLKYPHLIDGAMSASGPLLALADFKDYFRVVEKALQSYNDKCLEKVQEGTSQVDMFLQHIIGQRNIDKKFKLCNPIENSVDNNLDIANFYETLSGNFASIVQYNKDNRIGGNGKLFNITINTLCNMMTNETLGSSLDRLAKINSLLLNAYDQECLDYKYDKMITALQNISWGGAVAEGGRQWMYQTCTEFGFFQTSSYYPQAFGDKFPLSFFIQQCKDIFGSNYGESFVNDQIKRTNTYYGALNIQVDNVVFVHGSVDPWHVLGITKTINQKAPAIYIKGAAHCANMYPKSKNDLPQLNAARVEIEQHIDSWLRL